MSRRGLHLLTLPAADATIIEAGSQTVVRATIAPPFADNRVNWTLSGGGSISSGQGTTTTYSAPGVGTTASIVATSVADPSKSRTVTITVNPPIVSPGPPGPPGPGKRVINEENLVPDSPAPIAKQGESTGAKTASTPEQPRAFLRPTKRASSDVPPEPQKKKK
jgi:hypothetical protein